MEHRYRMPQGLGSKFGLVRKIASIAFWPSSAQSPALANFGSRKVIVGLYNILLRV
jgi:hypothetical protein